MPLKQQLFLLFLCTNFGLNIFANADTCDLDQLPLQSNFDMKKFLGTWYEEERTELQWGQNTAHSEVWTLFEATNGKIYMTYRGYLPGKGCSSPKFGFFTDTSMNGRVVLTAEAGRYELTFQVAHTDYVHYALVYMCYEPPKLGTCHKTKMHVSFLSRQPPLTTAQRSTLVSQLDNTCITEADLVNTTAGLCIAPTPDPMLVGR